MRLGLGLPNSSPYGLSRALLLDWARAGDDAGFESLGTVDRPNYDMWDPLITLAAAAAVTSQIRLMTTVLILPARNEVLVAKQAAVIDQLSEGRLILGVGLGSRPDDYEVFGATTAHRVTRFRRQIRRMREVWADARASDIDHGVLGPPPVQEPPPIVLGGVAETARRRALEIGDGLIFSAAARPADIAGVVERFRREAEEQGKPGFSFTGLVYVAIGGERELAEGAHELRRYYPVLVKPPEELMIHGPVEQVAEAIAAYAAAGLDRLVVEPALPDMGQVAALADHILPAYR